MAIPIAFKPVTVDFKADSVRRLEKAPGEHAEALLQAYDVLEAILYRYIEQESDADRIIAEGFDAATVRRVIRLVDFSEYKRRQAAPGLKVTTRAFGFGRRMPIAQRYVG